MSRTDLRRQRGSAAVYATWISGR